MIEMKMKVGGYLTSVRNIDTGEELITEPTHNLVTNSGIDLLLNGRRVSSGTTLIENFFLFTGNGDAGFAYPRFMVGCGTAATTPSMTTLQNFTEAFTNITSSGTATTLVDGKWHQRVVKTVSISHAPVTEIAFSPNGQEIFSRILLKNPIANNGTYTFTYDFFISLPYATRTFVSNLGGTGISGEIKVDDTYYVGYGGVSIPKIAPGYCFTSSNADGWVGPSTSNIVPVGLLTPYCFRNTVHHNPMFSTSTTLDFGNDDTTRLPYQSNGYCTCTAGPYVAGQGYRDFTYTVNAAYPTASSGVLNIAYLNLRGLAMRFGSYVNGSWVGQTLNKDAAHKLVITLRYTYTAE